MRRKHLSQKAKKIINYIALFFLVFMFGGLVLFAFGVGFGGFMFFFGMFCNGILYAFYRKRK